MCPYYQINPSDPAFSYCNFVGITYHCTALLLWRTARFWGQYFRFWYILYDLRLSFFCLHANFKSTYTCSISKLFEYFTKNFWATPFYHWLSFSSILPMDLVIFFLFRSLFRLLPSVDRISRFDFIASVKIKIHCRGRCEAAPVIFP